MLSDNKEILNDYKNSFHKLITVRRKLKALTTDEEDKDRALELLNYQIKELEAADISVGEKAELTKKKQLMENSEALLLVLNNALSALSGDDEFNGAATLVSSSAKEVSSLNSASENIRKISSRLSDISEEIEDIKDLINSEVAGLDFNEAEREQVEERLDLLYKLSAKYGETEEEMLAFLENAKEKRNSILYNDEELEKLTNEYDSLFDEVVKKQRSFPNTERKLLLNLKAMLRLSLNFLICRKFSLLLALIKANYLQQVMIKLNF